MTSYDPDVNLPTHDYTSTEEFTEDDHDDVSFDDLDLNFETINPMMVVPAPRGEEYIFDDDFARKKLSWGDRFSWLIGGGFITGSILGGVWGIGEGVRNGRGKARKLLINSVTRAVTNRGSRLGNGGAMLALLYSGIEGLTGSARRKEDSVNILVASTLCPIIYFSSAGARAVLGGFGGLVFGLGICAWRKYDTTGLKHLFG